MRRFNDKELRCSLEADELIFKDKESVTFKQFDAVLAMGSSSFFASNRSTFSSHIKEMRNCARFPGLNDCSPRTVSASESRTKLLRSLDLLASQG